MMGQVAEKLNRQLTAIPFILNPLPLLREMGRWRPLILRLNIYLWSLLCSMVPEKMLQRNYEISLLSLKTLTAIKFVQKQQQTASYSC